MSLTTRPSNITNATHDTTPDLASEPHHRTNEDQNEDQNQDQNKSQSKSKSQCRVRSKVAPAQRAGLHCARYFGTRCVPAVQFYLALSASSQPGGDSERRRRLTSHCETAGLRQVRPDTADPCANYIETAPPSPRTDSQNKSKIKNRTKIKNRSHLGITIRWGGPAAVAAGPKGTGGARC